MAYLVEVKELHAIWLRLSKVMDKLEKKNKLETSAIRVQRREDQEDAYNSLDTAIEYVRNALDYLGHGNGDKLPPRKKKG